MARQTTLNHAEEVRGGPVLDTAKYFPVLMILFAASGCAALIYEIVWYQLLQLVIGSTAVSLGVLLATFMGGLCLGSIGLPRLRAARWPHPLRIYALIEAGIGACGILVLVVMPLADRVYVAAIGHGLPAILLRALLCAICLLPPTLLMGASLPAVARWVKTTPRGVSWLGLLYAGNTLGAVFGCLLAGFYLLRVFDMTTATLMAVAINAAAALGSFLLSKRLPQQAAPEETEAERSAAIPASRKDSWPVYVTIALSGAAALGAEVVWTRLLGLMLGATVYTFSIILAVFLAGLALGSGAGARLSRALRPRAALGYAQLLLTAAIAWTAFMLAKSLPYWPVNATLSTSPWYTFQIDLVRVIWTILPPTLLWGASFPLALAAAAGEEDAGRLVGGVYAANTAGAIVGALSFSIVVIPWVGTQQAERALIALAAVSALFVLAPVVWSLRNALGYLALAASMLIAGFFVSSVSPIPKAMIAYGRRFLTSYTRSEIWYVGEGLNSSIAISRWDDGAIQFHVSGKVEASTEMYDMRLERMLGHLPALIHRRPEKVLVVGFGAGVTAGSFVTHPYIRRIVICEIEPLIPPVATRYFGQANYNVLHDPRTEMIYDDARHFVLTTPEKFDIITSDPIHPWVKGSATLYSKEYFEMVKAHLNPGGVVTQWVPLYESDEDIVKSEMATFFDVFPNGSIWANEIDAQGYDVYLLGEAAPSPTKIDLDALQAKLDSAPYARVAQSLREVGFGTTTDILRTYAGREEDLRPWLAGAAINRDRNLRLQYLAGLAVNNNREGVIYDEILSYRRFPSDLIAGSPERLQPLLPLLQPRMR